MAERAGGRRLRRRTTGTDATRSRPEQAFALADEESPAFVPGVFQG